MKNYLVFSVMTVLAISSASLSQACDKETVAANAKQAVVERGAQLDLLLTDITADELLLNEISGEDSRYTVSMNDLRDHGSSYTFVVTVNDQCRVTRIRETSEQPQ